MTPLEWTSDRDRDWGAALSGASLVAEIDVSDEDLARAIDYMGKFLRNKSTRAFRRKFPAFFAVVVTAVGMQDWSHGTFYPYVADRLGISEEAANQITREFHQAIQSLGLPDFEDAEGLRWITPVLLHGAVPLDDLDELLVLLARRRKVDPSLSGESFVDWARLNPGALVGQPKALERFLLHGGEFAPDYVARIIDFVDGMPSSLPAQVSERLQSLIDGGLTLPKGRASERPRVIRDSDGSIRVVLPGVRPLSGRRIDWQVSMGDQVRAITCDVPFVQGAETTEREYVDVTSPIATITVDREGHRVALHLVRKDDPLLVFDDGGEHVGSTRPIPPGEVTVMYPAGLSLRDSHGQALAGEAADVPYGWDRWEAMNLKLAVGDSVRLDAGPLHHTRDAGRAWLELPAPIPNLRATDGAAVVAHSPSLVLPADADPARWTVSVLDAGGTLVSTCVPRSLRLDPFETLRRPLFGTFTVTARGPLGRGVTRRVSIAEDIRVSADPNQRQLRQSALERCRVVVSGGPGGIVRTELRGRTITETLRFEGTDYVLEPDHEDFAVVKGDARPIYGIDAVTLQPSDVRDARIVIRSLAHSREARLELSSGSGAQSLRLPDTTNGRSLTVPLAKFSDKANADKCGTLSLVRGEHRVDLASVRPAQLAHAITYESGLLRVTTDLTSSLELAVFRLGAPWEAGRILGVENGEAWLPPDLSTGGPLRVQVRQANPWVSRPADEFPSPDRDTFDVLDLPWSAQIEASDFPGLVGFLLDAPGSWPELMSLPRVIELAGSRSRFVIPGVSRPNFTLVLRTDPIASLDAVQVTAAGTATVDAALIASGLVDCAPDELDKVDLVEGLLTRSSLAAMLAASATLARAEDHPARQVLGASFGGEFDDLLTGEGLPDAGLGRFDEPLLRSPGMVESWYRALAPVPAAPLDGDSRIAAAFELWSARSNLRIQAQLAMPCIARTRKVLETMNTQLMNLLMARLTQDGVLALPALTFALGLLARLAAHGHDPAAELYDRNRRHHLALAQHAPRLTSIDLIRADAAVIGSLS